MYNTVSKLLPNNSRSKTRKKNEDPLLASSLACFAAAGKVKSPSNPPNSLYYTTIGPVTYNC